MLEGGDVILDGDALKVDDSLVDDFRDDLYSGYSANACVLTCLREVIFLFYQKYQSNLSVHHMNHHVPRNKS